VILKPLNYPAQEAVIRLLEQILANAREGGVTSIAVIAVNPAGWVQTPVQGGQIREIARGTEILRDQIEQAYAQAVQMLGKYNSQRP